MHLLAIQSLQDTPFAALSLIAAPAVLTNASSVLALGTSNRFARAVDRQRQLSALLDADDGRMDPAIGKMRLIQLQRTERRGQLLLRALTSFYVSLGSFAAAALSSVLGAAVIPAHMAVVSSVINWIALSIGIIGVFGIVFGCALLVRETRLALAGLREEAAFSESRFNRRTREPMASQAPHRDSPR